VTLLPVDPNGPKRREHHCDDVKTIIRRVDNKLLQRGIKAAVVETSELTGVLYGTVKRIVHLPEGSLKRKRQKRTRSVEKFLNHNLILEMKNVIYNICIRTKKFPPWTQLKKNSCKRFSCKLLKRDIDENFT
jgi:hypothetical protein